MANLGVIILLLVLVAWRTSAQLDCTALNVERFVSAPLSGSDLSVCRTPSSQCCTQAYLDKVKRELGEELVEELQDEVRSTVRAISSIADTLAEYFEDEFLSSVRNGLPLASLYQAHIAEATAAFASLVSRSKFVINASNPEVNTTAIIVLMLDGIKAVIQGSSLPDGTKTCLIDGITSSVNFDAIRSLGKDLEEVRRAYTLLVRIWNYLNNFATTFPGFVVSNIPKTCIDRAIEIYFCGRCGAVIPPLCSNTCGALVRGCYAAFVTGLQDQFNRLWNVTRQAVNVVRSGIANIVEDESSLIDSAQLLSLRTRCLTPSNPLGKRQTQTTIPPEVETLVRSVRGLFVYGRLGPRFCFSEAAELRYCNGSSGAPSDRSCSSDEVCTSPCLCWNGQSRSPNDTVAFTGASIDEQDSNPVVKVPKEEYEAIVSSIGTPVNSFLTSSDVTAILPQNVTVPPQGSKASAEMVASMATLMGMVLFQLFVV